MKPAIQISAVHKTIPAHPVLGDAWISDDGSVFYFDGNAWMIINNSRQSRPAAPIVIED